MSGAVPPTPPATGGAIYEATAKAEGSYAEAERLAGDEYTAPTRLAGSVNQAELAMVMGRSVEQIRPNQETVLFRFNSHETLGNEIDYAITSDLDTMFTADELVKLRAGPPEQLVRATMLRRREHVYHSMANAIADDINIWLNRIKSAGTNLMNTFLTEVRTHMNALGTQRRHHGRQS